MYFVSRVIGRARNRDKGRGAKGKKMRGDILKVYGWRRWRLTIPCSWTRWNTQAREEIPTPFSCISCIGQSGEISIPILKNNEDFALIFFFLLRLVGVLPQDRRRGSTPWAPLGKFRPTDSVLSPQWKTSKPPLFSKVCVYALVLLKKGSQHSTDKIAF